jgi:mono/diheme cytochrome c family protein
MYHCGILIFKKTYLIDATPLQNGSAAGSTKNGIRRSRIMKTLLKPVLILTLILFVASTVLAAEGGNPRKGKHLFKKTCKTCHGSDGAGGEVTPMTKTQAQWDRLFEKKKHDQKAWEGLSDQDLKDIHQFLFDHAADSPQPQTCG